VMQINTRGMRDASLKKDTEEDFRKWLDASRWGTP